MTPHDELMALAGKIDQRAKLHPENYIAADLLQSTAADLRALLDSDAFRAMVRDVWLPIESAPRDDTVIVVMEATERNKAFANWRQSVPVYIDEHGDILDVGTSTPDVGIASDNWRATHWRPLPAPPQAIDAAASGAGEGE